MKKYRRQKPYDVRGKTNFRYTAGKSGVYIIYKNDKPVYVGMSGYNIYKTMYRHFQEWGTSNQTRTTYQYLKGITCRVILCTPKQAEHLEKMLILKYKPKDNPMKYARYSPTKYDKKVYDEWLGEPIESSPF